jgi:glycosyltransferase involved in cell wall biosynthesis
LYKAAWFSRRFLPAEGGVEHFLDSLAVDLGRDYDLRINAQIFDNRPEKPGCDDIFARISKPVDTELYKIRAIQPTFFDRLRLFPCILNILPFFRSRAYETTKRIAVNRFASVYKKRLATKCSKCAIVHSFAFGGMGLLARRVAESLQVPFVITPFMHRGKWGDAPHDISLYNSADAVIALHEEDKKELISAGVYSDIIRVCGIGVPPFSGNGEKFRNNHSINGSIVLFIGRLVAHKGWEELCEAVCHVNNNGHKLNLVLIGPNSSNSPGIEKYTKNSFIKYLGIASEEEKHDAIFASDLFCLPSRSEIFPVSILEAWHARKPVLVYDSPSIRSFVKNNETGRIIAPDKKELISALEQFATNGSRFSNLGSDGREELDKNYRIARISAWHRELYDELVSHGRESTQFNRRVEL